MNRCTSANLEGTSEKVEKETSLSAGVSTAILAIKSEPFNVKLKKIAMNKERIDKKAVR
jgi:hypothetical protein